MARFGSFPLIDSPTRRQAGTAVLSRVMGKEQAKAGVQGNRCGLAAWIPAFAGMSALRKDALFAWCESVPEPVAGSVIEGNCVAVRRGGEQPEMNRQSVG